MARESVTTQTITRAGLVPVMGMPSVDGDVIDAAATILIVENVGAGALTVTAQSPVTVDGLNVEELQVTVAAGDQALIGPFPSRTFGRPAGDPNAGRVYVDYSPAADASRAVVAL